MPTMPVDCIPQCYFHTFLMLKKEEWNTALLLSWVNDGQELQTLWAGLVMKEEPHIHYKHVLTRYLFSKLWKCFDKLKKIQLKLFRIEYRSNFSFKRSISSNKLRGKHLDYIRMKRLNWPFLKQWFWKKFHSLCSKENFLWNRISPICPAAVSRQPNLWEGGCLRQAVALAQLPRELQGAQQTAWRKKDACGREKVS